MKPSSTPIDRRMQRSTRAAFAALALFLVFLACSEAVVGRGTSSTWAKREHARIAGILIHTDVTAIITDTPLKTVFEQISEALGVSIIGRYDHPRHGLGLDPEQSISITVKETPAYVLIERILALAEDDQPVTWQIRDGFVEVGTKERLSVPAAREVRTYEISDLLRIENYYEGGGPVLTEGATRVREVQHDLVIELFDTILATVEPEAWEPGPVVGGSRGGDLARPLPARVGRYQRVPNTAGLQATGKWASMRTMKWDLLVVSAPDYIHRQIAGYPDAIPPKKVEGDAADAAQTEDRPNAAPQEQHEDAAPTERDLPGL